MDNTAAYYPPPPKPSIPLLSSSSYSRATTRGGATPSHDVRASAATIPPPHHQSYVPLASYDEVRTIFIAGLPADVKPREIYNLLREFPGYESSHLRAPSANTQPFAFAIFLDQQSAVAAMHALNGLVFDLEKILLYILILQNLIQDLSAQEQTMKDLCQRRG